MSRAVRLGLFATGAALCLGCATKSLPPGTPPPEYEKRTLEPWPSSPDGGSVDAAEAVAPTDPERSLGADDGGPLDPAPPPGAADGGGP
jgi:hypothetical protein